MWWSALSKRQAAQGIFSTTFIFIFTSFIRLTSSLNRRQFSFINVRKIRLHKLYNCFIWSIMKPKGADFTPLGPSSLFLLTCLFYPQQCEALCLAPSGNPSGCLGSPEFSLGSSYGWPESISRNGLCLCVCLSVCPSSLQLFHCRTFLRMFGPYKPYIF